MNTHAVPGNQHNAITRIFHLILFHYAAARQFDINQRVARFNGDGDDASFADIGKFVKRGLLYRALLGGKEEFTRLFPRDIFLVGVRPGNYPNKRSDGFARL